MHKSDIGMASAPNKLDLHGESSGKGDGKNKDTCESDVKGSDEFKIGCSSITLAYDGGTCACKYMNMRKQVTGDVTDVSARLDFENCTVGPKFAVLKLAVKKVPDAQFVDDPVEKTAHGSIVDYMRATCGKPTTTMVQSSAKVSVQVKQQAMGSSTCSGTLESSLKIPLTDDREKDRATCQNVCMGSIEKFAAMGEVSDQGDKCTGYAFSQDAKDENCLIYKGKWSSIDKNSSKPGSWNCWNMTDTGASFEESTPAPMSAEEKAALAAAAPKLAFTMTAETANVATVTSKVDGCFGTYTWIDLKDSTGAAGFLPAKESEWEELLEFIPVASTPSTKLATSDSVGCTMATRNIYWGAANGGKGGLVSARAAEPDLTTTTPAPCPVLQDCTTAEYINAAITAICTALVTWLCVYLVFDKFLKGKSTSQSEQKSNVATHYMTGSGTSFSRTVALNGEEATVDEYSGCDMPVLLILCLVAAIVAGITASLLSHLLGLLLTPICAASSHDLNLITEASSMAAFAAIAVALFWLSTRKSSGGGDEFKYMLIKVKDGQKQPIPVMKTQIVDSYP